tara:strand:+ start:347 stop:649 length:303 start_codon:yes stop_codon:yes gene_type:complete
MVETYELERKIQDEKTKEIWASIDEDFLDECEKHRAWYNNFTKKEHHPMSYQVKKEIEEWTPDEYKTFNDLFDTWALLCAAQICAWTSIGLLFLYFFVGG